MRIALAIVSLFPAGGLQRDCLALARLLRHRGHEVAIFCARLEAGVETEGDVIVLPNRAWTNHGRNARFARDLGAAVRGRFDRVVGFSPMPGLDVLYCADLPSPRRSAPRGLMPRQRALLALEGACFARDRKTRILLLTEQQARAYRERWNTEAERIHVLPPNLDPGRARPALRATGVREEVRRALGFSGADWVWLFIGSYPGTKGLDRLIDAIRAFPNARAVCVGVGETDRRARALVRQAESLGVAPQIRWAGYREDVPELMAAADVLVHPSRRDTTGGVILEALANGLPVITTAECGYAPLVLASGSGRVLDSPFSAQQFRSALEAAADPAQRVDWSQRAAGWAAATDLHSGLQRAATLITE